MGKNVGHVEGTTLEAFEFASQIAAGGMGAEDTNSKSEVASMSRLSRVELSKLTRWDMHEIGVLSYPAIESAHG